MADLDLLIAEITTDAYGDDEQLWAFLQALRDGIEPPSDGFVIGEPTCGSRKPSASLTGCSGSTLRTTKARAS